MLSARPGLRRVCLVRAAKGFGSKQEASEKSEKGVTTKSRKGKKVALRQTNPIGTTETSPNSREQKFIEQLDRIKDGSNADDQEFQKRLDSLKQKAKSSQKSREASAPAGPLSRGPLEKPEPEPEPSKPSDDSAGSSFGVPQVAVGVLSLLLVGVFVVTSGYGPAGPVGQQSQSQQVSAKQEEVQKAVRTQVEQLEQQLKDRPDNVDIKQTLSDLVTVLGDYRRARSLAEEVVKAEPGNSGAWLLLAEAQSRLLDLKSAAQSYKKSLEVTDQPSLQQLQGLAGALANDKKFEEAVQQLQRYETKAGKSEALGSVELQLLIGKVYSQWDRHFASALAVYDGLIEKYPEDFRGYLAKGALLKENGRKADAQRMFIQARFYAPGEARAVVEQIANR